MANGAGASGTAVLRELNRIAVLDVVRRAAPVPLRITEIADRTGLARPTVRQAVDLLIEQDWLVAVPGPDDRSVGRPATRFALDGRSRPVLGVDVGPHRVTAVVAEVGGRYLAVVRKAVGRSRAQDVLSAMDAAVRSALEEARVAPDSVAAATAASPGLIDAGSGTVTLAPSVGGWPSLAIVEHVSAVVPCRVRLENDANLAALALARAQGDPHGTLLAVQWGERLGAGIVIDGRLHRGARNAAGEIGFIGDGARLVTEGGRGELESRLSSEAIGRRGIEAAALHPRSDLATRIAAGADPAAAVFSAATRRDRAALAVVDEVAATFARAVAPVVLALAPDALVIGGGVARAGPVLARAIAEHLGERALVCPQVTLSELAEDSVVSGAVQLSTDDVWAAALS
ncbi:Sugar kinase of the NBD/HSP70 family, may contain an N-terminal HTH domain [Actinacidiphila yanglinensis]|uniref:Sugar kinase of the NBD/HSP70 family, may contain an N-terminal HTH domain n=1 Tax=Actinacidiphila yanglinensis TaxID=310779 RepID=A0A1H6B5E7_9ACTN|nr:ROK family transcriptional regulator [Actinacidiphila yanglinensis]SEG55336.1 Sugar kinase of the NBD/HSP70 family, may contain an N-terminal HTH domain [Actinacidiphila yanglinensis]